VKKHYQTEFFLVKRAYKLWARFLALPNRA